NCSSSVPGPGPERRASCGSRARSMKSSMATYSRSASTSDRASDAAGQAPGRGRLVVVATPIGNLGDLSARAAQALAGARYIYCEDTRRTLKLLNHCGIKGPRLVAHHRFNEAATTAAALERLEE